MLVLGFLAMVGSYYSPETGFTSFLTLPARNHAFELPAVQAVPHAHNDDGGYDGQFYAQMAVDPLLKNPAIDDALDTPAYRSHRILFSWTAWAIGLGRPAWVLHAYAVQNVFAWLVLAGVLLIWFPPRDGRTLVLWAGVLFSHGLLSSVRNAVPDGPSVLLTAAAVIAADRARPWLSAMITGVAGLGRETNVLAGVVLLPTVRRWRVMALILCVVPLAFWLDYLRSVYGADVLTGGNSITVPLSGLWWKVKTTTASIAASGLTPATLASATALLAFLAQGVALAWCTREWRGTRLGSRSWLLVAWTFLLLGLVAHPVVWEGVPGAIGRVTLPLTVGVNALLAAQPRPPWWLIIMANLGVVSGLMAL